MKYLCPITGCVIVGGFALAALAQDPTHITMAFQGDLSPTTAIDQRLSPQDEVLHDSLYIAYDGLSTMGNGNANSGLALFDALHDLEVCDQFTVDYDFYVTEVTIASLSYFQGYPANGIDVGLFPALSNGEPANEPAFEATWPSESRDWIWEPWCLPGVESTAIGDTGLLPSGTWFIRIKPCDFTDEGDWYYCLRADTGRADCYMRDGDNGEGGYGTTTWVSATEMGYGYGESAIQVVGYPADSFRITLSGDCPGEMTLTATGATVGRLVAFLYSDHQGPWTIPGIQCSGTVLGVVNPTIIGFVRADESRQAAVSGRVPPPFCGNYYFQALDLGTCTPSNVVGI